MRIDRIFVSHFALIRPKRRQTLQARGKNDQRQSFTKAEIVEGGTMGPAPG